MEDRRIWIRHGVIAVLLALGALWSLVSALQAASTGEYPNAELLAGPEWLHNQAGDDDILIVDIRTDDHFDGRLIPGAIRLPWSQFRYNDTAANEAELFVGTSRAQEILGSHGVGRTNTVVLYDSVARDGGATASYVFWVLDVLGHADTKILEGGIDAWEAAGYELASTPRDLSPILYQAPMEAINRRGLIDGDDVYRQLGDPHYQIIDVRSPAEYRGEKGTRDLRGNPLKLGHVPTAVNIDYAANWVDTETKRIKPYAQLQELYRGLDTRKSVIVYCNSGRRSSFSYFVLRLMGIDDAATYEASWKQWGNPSNFYPVETAVNTFAGQRLPGRSSAVDTTAPSTGTSSARRAPSTGADAPRGGYVSCGG